MKITTCPPLCAITILFATTIAADVAQRVQQPQSHRSPRYARLSADPRAEQPDEEIVAGRRLIDEPDCTAEVQKLCTGLMDNSDLLVLECLHSLRPNVLAQVSNKCQHHFWTHTREIIENEKIQSALMATCRSSLERIDCHVDDKPTHSAYFKCILANKDDLTPDCVEQVERFESVAFSDFRWIALFLESCDADIERLRCGRIDHDRISQSETMNCLHDNITMVSKECHHEVFKLSQVQADNIKFDQQMYMACVDDQLRYCPQFKPGSGRVFKCLWSNRSEKLSSKCRNQLLRREKLIAQDYRISRGLMRACREDIKNGRCRKQVSDDRDVKLAQVLLCLENMKKNGTKITSECDAEISDHRKILMEDYRVSPEIVKECSDDISTFCKQLEVGGRTIHCLMEHTRNKKMKNRVSANCQRALENLVKASDVGEDWRVDPVLYDYCNSFVQSTCHDVRGGDARVINCLIDNIGNDHMPEKCQDALMQIQYFVARDFKLDPQLYRNCREDATHWCKASHDWQNNEIGADNGPMVLPCLYRYAYQEDKKMQLKPACLTQIKRVMRQRAVSVGLHPKVEEACIDDLSLHCYDKIEKGQEMICLQDKLDKLTEECRKEISDLTEIEAEHTDLNPYISNHCRQVIDTFCHDEKEHDEGDIMECLIKHKNHPVVKMENNNCRVSIEHFQLISLKDYKFTYKFKIACKPYAVRHCHAAKTIAEVVACLSEKLTNDTLSGVKSDIQKDCRQQLKSQIFQQRENIDFDPKLSHACETDIKTHCSSVSKGSAQVLECLQSIPDKKLTNKCQIELFRVQKQETSDNSVDYALMTMCASAIDKFCPNVKNADVLECLKTYRDKRDFNRHCRTVVIHRIIEQNSDYRLNPGLRQNCNTDIERHCTAALSEARAQGHDEHALHGAVIKCLKVAFKASHLTSQCEKEMAEILRQQALDVQLNPLLRTVCTDELSTICKQDTSKEDAGAAEECLKIALLANKLQAPACREEVANLIEESHADINVDPVLQSECALDLLKYCKDIEQGNGRLIRCLSIIKDDRTMQLTPDCKSMLNKRLEMYRNAEEALPAPEDLQQLYGQVTASPSKQYFLLVFLMMVSSTFVIGMLCGRVSRRHILLKNK